MRKYCGLKVILALMSEFTKGVQKLFNLYDLHIQLLYVGSKAQIDDLHLI